MEGYFIDILSQTNDAKSHIESSICNICNRDENGNYRTNIWSPKIDLPFKVKKARIVDGILHINQRKY